MQIRQKNSVGCIKMNNVVNLDKVEKQKEWNRRKEWKTLTKDAEKFTCSVELTGDEWITVSIALDLLLKSGLLSIDGFISTDFKKSIERVLCKLDIDKLLTLKDNYEN